MQDMSGFDFESNSDSAKPLLETIIIKPDLSRPKRKTKNPWDVHDASDFLKYCCPECDYSDQNLPEFTYHALENHVLSNTLFATSDDHEAETRVKNERPDDNNYKEEYPGIDIKEEPMDYGKILD